MEPEGIGPASRARVEREQHRHQQIGQFSENGADLVRVVDVFGAVKGGQDKPAAPMRWWVWGSPG